MRTKFFIILVAAFAVLALRPALAQSVDAPQVEPKKKPKAARVKPAPVAASPTLPCSRAKEGSIRAGDVTISPKAKVNQDSPQATYGNNPNPNPSTSQFGGGLGVGFHF